MWAKVTMSGADTKALFGIRDGSNNVLMKMSYDGSNTKWVINYGDGLYSVADSV